MLISRSCLVLTPLLALLAATPSPEATSGSGDAADLERNRQLLDKWKSDPEHYARLQRDLHDFWALPKAQRRRLRQLDRDVHQLDARTQKHLWKIAQRYSAWLERLPEDQRRRIEETSDTQERLRLIQALRARQWMERLPHQVRADLDKLPEAARMAEAARLREQERQQRLLWKRPVNAGARPNPPARNAVLPPLPHKPIVRFDDLSDKAKVEAGTKISWEQRRDAWERLRRVEGKWPEWALTFHSLLSKEQRERMPPLGASRPDEFPAEVREFIKKTLKSKVSAAELRELRKVEGKWPEYPQHLLRLAEKHKLEVPGMSVPGSTEW